MNYKEFQNEIQATIRETIGVNYEVNLHRVMKNNDIEMVAISIRQRSTIGAVPTIYLEDFYEMYCAGISIRDIANQIIAIYYRQNGKVRISIDDFKNFQSIKDKIMIKLVNYERNFNGLKNTPHKRILDLAIVFYVLWEDEGEQRMTSTIRESHMALWGVDVEELYKVAYENTITKLSVNIRNMQEIVYDIYRNMRLKSGMDKNVEREILMQIEENTCPMYIVSNQKKILGASAILYDQALKYFYEKFGGEYYILPSSIHEVIVLQKNHMSVNELREMVTMINENEVDYLEVLSDNVYCYNGTELVML